MKGINLMRGTFLIGLLVALLIVGILVIKNTGINNPNNAQDTQEVTYTGADNPNSVQESQEETYTGVDNPDSVQETQAETTTGRARTAADLANKKLQDIKNAGAGD
jgi:competence protein ComGC